MGEAQAYTLDALIALKPAVLPAAAAATHTHAEPALKISTRTDRLLP